MSTEYLGEDKRAAATAELLDDQVPHLRHESVDDQVHGLGEGR